MEYSVLLASYNEAENIPIVVEQITATFKSINESRYEIILVDDNSPDGTAEVFKRLNDKVFPATTMKLVSRGGKMGLGTAYIAGLKVASGKYVIIMDADLSHQPRHIAAMVTLAKKDSTIDIVSGTRYSDGGGVVGWPLTRRLISCVSNEIVAALFSPQASDVTGSFRLYRRTILEKVCSQMNSVGYSFQCEAILRAEKLGAHVVNCPIEFVDRVYGESCFNFREAKQFLYTVATLAVTL